METRALELAALFHDVGYLANYENHESEGNRIFLTFAQNHGLASDLQHLVTQLIDSTKKTHRNFSNPLAKIMHDIDRAAMGMPGFIEQGLKLRKEWEHLKGLETNDREWFEFQVQYLEKTTFKTGYGVSTYNTQRIENLQNLKSLLAEMNQ